MKMWQQTTIAVIIAGTVLASSTSSFANTNEYQEAFIELLDRRPATYLGLSAHGRTSEEIDKRLAEIYHDNGLQPFWIENGKPTRRAADIISILEDAQSHGLDPDRYYLNRIVQYMDDSKDAADLVRLDVLLSLGMMLYVADQREGRIIPREIDPVLFESASDEEVDWVALREAAFGSADMKAFLEQQAPPFLQYRKLQEKMAEYRAIAAEGGWSSITGGETLKPGMDDPRVRDVKQRLSVTGDLVAGDSSSSLFDAELEEAVKRFQKRHNLNQDGAIGKQTLAAMNVPVEARINQINVNMERYRWLNRDLEDRRVVVNIAGFEALAGKPGKLELTMPVVVGKLHHATPVFSDTIKYIVFNPYWTLPPSIARNETLPKLKKNPQYLQEHNMKLFNGWGGDSKEIDPSTIDWSRVTKKEMNQYRVRQEPGPKNALGTLKIMFPNKYSVYLHDTPSHALFKREKRAFSHGCIRMGRPAEMASWVLGGEANGWGIARVNEIVKSRERKVVVLDKPIPVHILYRTAFVDPEDDTIVFYEDIYGRDKILARACCKNLLAQE